MFDPARRSSEAGTGSTPLGRGAARPAAYEFFSGGGLARLGLAAAGFEVVRANDLDPMKCAAYRAAFADAPEVLIEGDVAQLSIEDLPGRGDLAWASFPCQDLSLAGDRAGLSGARSGTFWAFWRLIEGLDAAGRGPRTLVIENVLGLASSGGGADFDALAGAIGRSGRRFAALAIDAALFLPQSRPRLFVIAWRGSAAEGLRATRPPSAWTPSPLARALSRLSGDGAAALQPLDPGAPEVAVARLESLLEPDDAPDLPPWRSAAETARLLSMMTERHRASVETARAEAAAAGARRAGALYRRTRPDGQGGRTQRAEIRFDRAGCLRTPAGGSSRQTLLIAEPEGRLRARLLSAREAARLMGAPDGYPLPARYNDAYKIAGDGVAAPVAEFIGARILRPLLGL
ncbi:MAG: DNA cytosine methyltransferase [Pseudomonadota bacterium]